MRNSYIAKDAEALNLHSGTQTAIVVKMKVQPTPPKAIYAQDDCKIVISDTAILQGGVYASRVLWNCKKHPHIKDCTVWENNLPYPIGQEVYVRERWMNVYDSINKKTTPTRFKIVGCEAIRVQGLTVGNGLELGCSSGNWGSARKLIISKFGQSAWDNNDYIWFYKI